MRNSTRRRHRPPIATSHRLCSTRMRENGRLRRRRRRPLRPERQQAPINEHDHTRAASRGTNGNTASDSGPCNRSGLSVSSTSFARRVACVMSRTRPVPHLRWDRVMWISVCGCGLWTAKRGALPRGCSAPPRSPRAWVWMVLILWARRNGIPLSARGAVGCLALDIVCGRAACFVDGAAIVAH